jgi:hypothetical protein
VAEGTVLEGVDDSALPPYVEAEKVDFNIKADLDTAATILSIITSLVLIGAYLEVTDG